MIAIRPPILLYVAKAARFWQAALAGKRSMPRKARMSLLDGKIEAAAGTVVGAKDQHHIFVADGAAHGLFITHQCHGVNSTQPLHQTLRVILALIARLEKSGSESYSSKQKSWIRFLARVRVASGSALTGAGGV